MRTIRKFLLLVIPLLAGALMLQGTPAQAAAGGGVVTGTVNTSGGVPLTPGSLTSGTFTFNATVISGTLTVTQSGTNATFAGAVSVVASGSATDTSAGGTGSVTSLTGTAPGLTVSESAALNSTFVRTGSLVLVGLWLTATVTTPTTTTTASGLVYVEVVANFVPTGFNAALTHAHTAAFAGVWAAS